MWLTRHPAHRLSYLTILHACLLTRPRCAVQVVALKLRSRGPAGQPLCAAEEEMDFALILNRALPEAIRVLGWADVKPDFHARWVQLTRGVQGLRD